MLYCECERERRSREQHSGTIENHTVEGGNDMAILVTGGAGFIGSHTCVELLNAGYEVVVVDNLYKASEKSLERVKQIT